MAEHAQGLWAEGKVSRGCGVIFVTVGTHNTGFNRLVKAADAYAATTLEKVIIQKGSSSYVPQHADYFDFAPSSKIAEISNQASIIITHAGAGSVLTSLASQAITVVVPRMKKWGEVVDDHQFELAEAIQDSGQGYMLSDVDDLATLLRTIPMSKPTVNTGEAALVSYLKGKMETLDRLL